MSYSGIWRTVGRWALALIILVWVLRWLGVNLDKIRKADAAFSLPWVLASGVLLVVYLVSRVLVWQRLTTAVGAAIPLPIAAAAWFYSQLGKYVPGKVFLFFGRLYFYVREGCDPGLVSLAFGIELVATLAAWLIIVTLTLFHLGASDSGYHAAGLLAVVGALCAVLHPGVLRHVVRVLAKTSNRSGVVVAVPYSQMLQLLGLYTLNAVILGVGVFALVRSLYPLEWHQLRFVMGAFFLATLGGAAAVFVPSGLGVREGIMAVFLSQIMPAASAAVSTLATRIWLSLVELICVLVATVVVRSCMPPSRADIERLHRGLPT